MSVNGERLCMIDYVTKTLNLPVLLFDKIIAPRCRVYSAIATALLLYSSLYQLCWKFPFSLYPQCRSNFLTLYFYQYERMRRGGGGGGRGGIGRRLGQYVVYTTTNKKSFLCFPSFCTLLTTTRTRLRTRIKYRVKLFFSSTVALLGD